MKRILIVDDNANNLYLLRSLLQGHGYAVDEACNGAEALPAARRNIPDMIISDILMPEMDGFTLCRLMKKEEGLKDIPFIFYTATYTDPRDEKLALTMGADAFIIKPTEPEEFISLIETVLMANKDRMIPLQQKQAIEEEVILKEYNEALIRKLEQKMQDLELTNKALEAEIVARKQAEESLRDSEERYRSLFENSMDGVFLTEPNGKILKANPAACRIFGRSENEIVEAGRSGLVDITDPRLKNAVEEREKTGKFSGELTCLRRDGTKFPCEISSAIFKDNNDTLKTSMILRDITERKKAEESLVTALQDKDALLKEIHHRVKNNMQIINSMINLQLNASIRFMTPDEIITVAFELQNRIRSIALVHDLLYRSKNLSRINFSDYVHSLVDSLSIAYHVGNRSIRFSVNVTDEPISIVVAIPIGQILNEMISNALKHAFPAGREGEIRIAMAIDDKKDFDITVRDNGAGLPDDFNIKTVRTFGIHLVSLLVEQLGGSIECRNDNGAIFTIRFTAMNGEDRLETFTLL